MRRDIAGLLISELPAQVRNRIEETTLPADRAVQRVSGTAAAIAARVRWSGAREGRRLWRAGRSCSRLPSRSFRGTSPIPHGFVWWAAT